VEFRQERSARQSLDHEPYPYQGWHTRKGAEHAPPDLGYTRVCYALGRRAASFQAAVAISEDERSRPNPTRFLVLGDGKVLWRSDSIRDLGVTQEVSLDVGEVQVLELRVYVETGICYGSHAVWIDPSVTVKP
jgi:hypothetical protein